MLRLSFWAAAKNLLFSDNLLQARKPTVVCLEAGFYQQEIPFDFAQGRLFAAAQDDRGEPHR
jgi:hypothetical protein